MLFYSAQQPVISESLNIEIQISLQNVVTDRRRLGYIFFHRVCTYSTSGFVGWGLKLNSQLMQWRT